MLFLLPCLSIYCQWYFRYFSLYKFWAINRKLSFVLGFIFWLSPHLLQCRRLPDNNVLCLFAKEHFPSHLSMSTFLCTDCHVTPSSAAWMWGTLGLWCKARALLVLWRWALWWEMTLDLFPIMLPGQSRKINVPLPSDPWHVFLPARLGLLGQSRHM